MFRNNSIILEKGAAALLKRESNTVFPSDYCENFQERLVLQNNPSGYFKTFSKIFY